MLSREHVPLSAYGTGQPAGPSRPPTSLAEFRWTTHLPAGVQAVAAFHAQPLAIRKLTPFVVPMSLHRMDPLAEGSLSEFTLWFGPIPVRWTALHTEVDLQRGFTDIQTDGPFAYWVHRHEFLADGDTTTQVVERICYQHREMPGGWLTRILFSPLMLWMLFSYRSLVMKLALAGAGHRSNQPLTFRNGVR